MYNSLRAKKPLPEVEESMALSGWPFPTVLPVAVIGQREKFQILFPWERSGSCDRICSFTSMDNINGSDTGTQTDADEDQKQSWIIDTNKCL